MAQFKDIKVMKFSKFLQGLFYLLEYKWDGIVEPGTQKFFWKTAKAQLNDEFVEKMKNYQTMGPKEGAFTKHY